MTTATYVGRAKAVTWGGVEFPRGEPVTLDPDNHKHAHILSKVPGNPYFEMGGAASSEPERDPATQETAEANMRAQLKEAGVTVPGRAGTKWMTDKLEELRNG